MKKRSIYLYVSILKRAATLPLSLRWGFETASNEKFKWVSMVNNSDVIASATRYPKQFSIRGVR
ncbi:MAG: hypothetical protein C4548_07495 [Desulfobacteraceae bacterium]|nr:MAG: hypothetical protein C4548_07495 [Desulfobacteraceae bacterium]